MLSPRVVYKFTLNHSPYCHADLNAQHVILGPVKNAINSGLYIALITGFIAMQADVEWQKYKLKQTPQLASPSPFQGIFGQPGMFTIVVAIVSASHLTIIMLVPNESRNKTFYIAKVAL